MSNFVQRASRLVVVLSAAALVAGCASPANPQNMILRASDATELRSRTPDWSKTAVGVKEVNGGSETNPMWTSQISSSAFRTALEESLKSVGMLAEPGKSRYEVVATLSNVQQPFMGASMTVTVTVNYILVDRVSRKTVSERSLTTPYTAAWNDAFAGTERLRLANEGAVRESVAAFVKHLQSLDAQAVAVK